MLKLPQPKTIIEPFRIHSVERLPILTIEERSCHIHDAHYNVFRLPASAVTFDLLTDSGTGAMSTDQWAGIMVGDESYAGSRSFLRFEQAVQELTGFEHVIPTHQGRAAEALLMKASLKSGQIVIGNTHFDTTRANIESVGATAMDLPCPESARPDVPAPFKGNIELGRLESTLRGNPGRVAFIIMTVTNNSVGGQPVSLSNLREARAICSRHGLPMYIDCARFAENAFFIKHREPGAEALEIRRIAREMFACADGALMSAKKDGLANIGGFLALRNADLAQDIRNLMVITEGFPTYGGLAGRDLEAVATGLNEVLDENYLAYRVRSTEYFGDGIDRAGLRIVKPVGGHAVYIDAAGTLPQIPWHQYPGQALSVALYEAAGIRSVEVGSVMLGRRDWATGEEKPAPMELVRLAIPRRTYTQSHVDYMIEMIGHLAPRMGELRGYAFEYQARFLRHFTAKFRRL